MFFKKAVSTCLILSQLGLVSSVLANEMTVPTISQTPETTLLENVIALQGESLSETGMQTQLNAIVSQYISTSPAEGRTERLGQALVSMNIYAAAEATSFIADADALNAHVARNEMTVETAVLQLAGLHPHGAQFSACAAVGVGTAVAGLAAIFAGADNVSATSQPVRFGVAVGGFVVALAGVIVLLEAC